MKRYIVDIFEDVCIFYTVNDLITEELKMYLLHTVNQLVRYF